MCNSLCSTLWVTQYQYSIFKAFYSTLSTIHFTLTLPVLIIITFVYPLLLLFIHYTSVKYCKIQSIFSHSYLYFYIYIFSYSFNALGPQQPECHKASDKVQSPKFATVEIEIILKNTQMESTVLVSLF